MEFQLFLNLHINLVCLALSEHKNGVHFPDDESIAVSALNTLWIILPLFLKIKIVT